MTRIYSYTQPLDADIVDAFCLMQKGFTDQFVYYRKDRPTRFMGEINGFIGLFCQCVGR